jgi:hypothetical protein
MTRRRLVRVAAPLSIPLAAVLVVLALDVLRWERSLEAQDVRFAALPAQSTFSRPGSRLPGNLAEWLLDGGDDLLFRATLQQFARVRPRLAGAYAEQRQLLRTEAQLQLSSLSLTDADRARRSRAANMSGVLALDPNEAPSDPAELANLIAGAVAAFRNAVEIDPSNADAKHNLELALRIPGFANLPGSDPSGSRDGGDRAGAGSPGGGY